MKLAYVVTEKGCMDPTTGAYQHISVGIRELSKYFDLVSFLPETPKAAPLRKGTKAGIAKRGKVYGALRDLRDFWRLTRDAWSVAKRVKQAGCSMAYVRVQSLSPVSALLKLRGVKTFLEANGLQFESRKRRFESLLSFVYEPYERWIYRHATYVFFVGSYGDYWQLDPENWCNVENGIEDSAFKRELSPKASVPPLRVCLVARLVGHHRIDVLVEALARINPAYRKCMELHLIGSGFDAVIDDLAECAHTVDHGHVARADLPELLQSMHLGLITGGPQYSSHMKLFDYAANGCLVVAPRTYHLERCFGGHGICFFDPEDSASLAKALQSQFADGQDRFKRCQTLRSLVYRKYTWTRIFEQKATIMLRHIGE